MLRDSNNLLLLKVSKEASFIQYVFTNLQPCTKYLALKTEEIMKAKTQLGVGNEEDIENSVYVLWFMFLEGSYSVPGELHVSWEGGGKEESHRTLWKLE